MCILVEFTSLRLTEHNGQEVVNPQHLKKTLPLQLLFSQICPRILYY